MSFPKSSERYLSATAKPTPVENPWPKGPVVMSMPIDKSNSGCPGVFESNCRKFFKSSFVKSKPFK